MMLLSGAWMTGLYLCYVRYLWCLRIYWIGQKIAGFRKVSCEREKPGGRGMLRLTLKLIVGATAGVTCSANYLGIYKGMYLLSTSYLQRG